MALGRPPAMAGILSAVMFLSLSSCTSRPPPLADVALPITTPGWIRFKPHADVDARSFLERYGPTLELAKGTEMRATSEETDELGIRHLRYQQYFRGVEVEGAEFLVHAREQRALSANGRLALRFAPEQVEPGIDEAGALEAVEAHLGSTMFYDGARLVEVIATGEADYRPRGTLVFTELRPDAERVLAWRFDAYVDPLDTSRRVYADAATGAIVKEIPLLPNCFGTSAATTFRGTQNFNTARATIPGLGERFVLVDDCHDNQLRQQSFNFTSGTSKEVFDNDNDWTGVDQSLLTSFWSLGVAYDYFDLVLGRKSYDNKNSNMVIINDPTLGNNAAGGGGVITIGLANAGPADDYNTTDIVGHEFTHSVVEKTAQLGYDADAESAALNESFSDILGEMTEAWEESTQSPDWIIGADKGCAGAAVCRNLANPKAFGHPDTYQGSFWQTPPGVDPHVNGTVQNRWFALVASGGNGTNSEIGVPYSITGLGIAKAQRIAFRNLTRYLVSGSNYLAARDGSIQAAIDLHGPGSPEEGAVTQAWCAVGLCPFSIPKQPDRFDRPGGNPNPASPNNNNTLAGATPIGQLMWNAAPRPRLAIPDLSVYPAGDRDYFQISLPAVDLAGGGRCFPVGVSFSISAPVDVRILDNGNVLQTLHNTSSFKVGGIAGTFVVEVGSPFPGLILDYAIDAGFYQSVDQSCWQTEPPTVFEQIQDCPMCDVGLLTGIDEIVLDPDHRQPGLVAPVQHYFRFGGGDLEIPVEVTQGNGLRIELVDSSGRVLERSAWAPGTTGGPAVQAPNLPEGIYSLRFTGYGNSTRIRVQAPAG